MVFHIHERKLHVHVGEVHISRARRSSSAWKYRAAPANKRRQTRIIIAPQRRLLPDKKRRYTICICEYRTLICRLAFVDLRRVVCFRSFWGEISDRISTPDASEDIQYLMSA